MDVLLWCKNINIRRNAAVRHALLEDLLDVQLVITASVNFQREQAHTLSKDDDLHILQTLIDSFYRA